MNTHKFLVSSINCIFVKCYILFHYFLNPATIDIKHNLFYVKLLCSRINNILTLILLQLWPAFSTDSSHKKAFRLSPKIVPYNYDLTVVTHLGDMGYFSFNGFVNITIASKGKHTKEIKIHAKELDIPQQLTRINHESSTKNSVRIIDHKIDTVNDFYIIYLDEPLTANSKYILSITFSGVLTDRLMGYYREKYTDTITRELRWFAVTQFQPTEARRAFPCFDEPSFKATFKISLVHMDKYTSISNMPLSLSEEIEPGWVKNTFMLTERMSPYTVAYTVSDFAHLTSKAKANEPVFQVWSRPDVINQTSFALSVGRKLLKYYEQYFKIRYPLPKLDLMGVPNFLLSGMENWGLILFRENLLLTDLSATNALPLSECAMLVSHEIAHQWFGNLVTMKWWTDIWLNEGFATHMESKAIDHLFPQWNVLPYDILNKLRIVFTLDGYVDSHPVSVRISHPDEILQVFDDISYKKGGLLIRMINSVLGENVFRRGLTSYLKELSYANADKDDLWQHLTVHAHKFGALPTNTSVNEIMDPWLLQTGYPVVTVIRDYKRGTITLSQKKFLFTETNNNSEISKYCWTIPITYTTRKTQDFKNTKPKIWLTCKNDNSEYVTEVGRDDWIILNVQLSGLYRVQYDLHNWKHIKNALLENHTSIDVMNRAQIILDVFDFAWNGNLGYRTALNLATYMTKERNYFPWSFFLEKIQKLYILLRDLKKLDALREYMTDLMQPMYKEWPNFAFETQFDDLESPKLHLEFLSAACRFKIFDCGFRARRIFNKYMKNYPNSAEMIPDRLMPIIFCYAINDGGEKEWNFLWNIYLTSRSTQILQALTFSKDVKLLERLLNISHTEGSVIRQQDSAIVFKDIAINSEIGHRLAKDFLMRKTDKLFEYYKTSDAFLGYYLESLALPMMTEDQLHEVTNFIKKYQRHLKSSSKSVKSTLAIVKENIEWYKHRYSAFLSAITDTNENKKVHY